MKKIISAMLSLIILFSLCGCRKETEKLPVKVLIVPHFEIAEMKDDVPGEAQLFFEEYFGKCDVYSVCGGISLYYNPENKAAMYLTGEGKTNAAYSTTAVLSDGRFDFSDSYILGVGCAGSAIGYATLGDVVLESAVCDYDLGHTADIRDMQENSNGKLWFPSSDYDDIGCKKFDPDTIARAYELAKDIKLESTDISRGMLARNFPEEEWAMREPIFIKGTAITSDDYWKGRYNHDKALQVTEYYKCPDPYAVTEMEDVAIASVAERFGLLDRTIILRTSVNIDVFFDNAKPESLWGENTDYTEAFADTNEETLDIFAPAMENLYKAGKIIIDSILTGEF